MPHTLVLAVGRDSVLLETRSQVLQAAGYTVIPERSLKKAVARFREGDFDLVLLCHSIPAQDRERLTLLLREHTSRTPHCFCRVQFERTRFIRRRNTRK